MIRGPKVFETDAQVLTAKVRATKSQVTGDQRASATWDMLILFDCEPWLLSRSLSTAQSRSSGVRKRAEEGLLSSFQ